METQFDGSNLQDKWFKSLEDTVTHLADFFLALSYMLFWGFKIIFKCIFYGGPNKKKPWIIKLLKLLIQILKVLLRMQEEKEKEEPKKEDKKDEK